MNTIKNTNRLFKRLVRRLDRCIGSEDTSHVLGEIVALGHPDGIPVLVEYLGVERGPIVEAAIAGLVAFGETAVPAVVAALDEPDADVQRHTRRVLDELGRTDLYRVPPKTSAELLAEALARPPERIDPLDFEELAWRPVPAAAPLFGRVLENPRCHRCLRVAAALGLAQLHGRSVADVEMGAPGI